MFSFQRFLFTIVLSATTLAAAEPREFSPTLTRGSMRGVLVPIQNVPLSTSVAGVIEEFGGQEGQQVAKGDLLVQLNSRVEKAELARAEAVLETTVVETARAQRELDRTKELVEKNNIGSRKELEDAQANFQIMDGRRKQAEAEVQLAKARLDDRSIKATFTGLLFRRSHAVGEAVMANEPVVRLIDISKLGFSIYGPPEFLGKFKVGEKARILVESGSARGTTIEGTVAYVDPTLDPETSTFRVRFEIEPTDQIQSGINVTLQLPSEVH